MGKIPELGSNVAVAPPHLLLPFWDFLFKLCIIKLLPILHDRVEHLGELN